MYKIGGPNAWQCTLPNYGETVDVRWNPYDASFDNHDSWQVHSMSCEFDFSQINLTLEINGMPYIDIHLHKKYTNAIARIQIPSETSVTGNFLPAQLPKDSHPNYALFGSQESRKPEVDFPRISLCIGGVFGIVTFYYIVEWVVHHLNIGVSHIYIGFDELPDSSAFEIASNILQYFIERGYLSLISTKMPHMDWNHASKYSQPFTYECVYYSKLRGDMVVGMDIDEFLVPHSKDPIHVILHQYLQDIKVELKDLCSFTFSSFCPHAWDGYNPDQGFLGDRFPNRWKNAQHEWIKSMAYTENVYAGFTHIPGACMVSDIALGVAPNQTTGAFIVPSNIVAMHHFKNSIVPGKGWRNESSVPDEYATVWGKMNKESVCWMFQQKIIDSDWYASVTGLTFEYDCDTVSSKAPAWI